MNLKPKSWKKISLIAITLNLLLIGSLLYVIYASPSLMTMYLSGGIYPSADSYTIFKEDSIYYAKTAYGEIKYSDSVASTVINNAINALPSIGGSIVFSSALAEPEYVITSAITINDKSDVTLKGDGRTKLILGNNANCRIVDANNATRLKIIGLWFDGNKDNQVYSGNRNDHASICMIYSEDVYIHNVKIENTLAGASIVADTCDRVVISDSTFLLGGVTETMCDGIWIGHSKYPRVSNCMAKNFTDTGYAFDNNIDAIIVGCHAYDCDEQGISSAVGNDGHEISACTLRYNKYGLKLFPAGGNRPENIFVSTCRITDNTNTGIYIDATRVEITNSYILNNPTQVTLISGSTLINIHHNSGFVTENSGSQSGTSPITITHGLAETPTCIIITPTSDADDFYVTNEGGTTFQIAFTGAGEKTFYWYAEYHLQ